MKLRSCVPIVVVLLATVLAGTAARADDRDLFRTDSRPPNVFLVLDSGSTTTQDVANSRHLMASGDDPDSKLVQEKDVLKWFFNTFPGFNYGFSYSIKDNPSYLYYLNFLYRTATADEVAPQVAGPLLDGSTEVRMGDSADPWHNGAIPPFYAIRFGRDGDQQFLSYLPSPKVGDPIYVSYLVTDASGTTPKIADASPYYYPAYNWNGLAGLSHGNAVQKGLTGQESWEGVYEDIFGVAPDTTDVTRAWERRLRDAVLAVLESVKINNSNDLLYIKEEQHTIEQVDKKTGKPTKWSEEAVATKVTAMRWVQNFVLYDRYQFGDDSQQISSTDTLTAFEWKSPGVDCQDGFMRYDNGGSSEVRPIVPVPVPDPARSCTTPDTRELIKSYLSPQTTPLFYFPGTVARFIPQSRELWIPATDTVIAGGRRPLGKLLEGADKYFQSLVDPNDDCQKCRKNYLIILTDGFESCSNATAPIQQAKQMAASGIVDGVYMVMFASEDQQTDTNVSLLQAIVEAAGGDSDAYWATSKEDLIEKLGKLGRSIIERTAAFAAPSVPSVELTTKEKGYISTFVTVNDRSLWEGHLRAYAVDPTTGTIPTTPKVLGNGTTIYVPQDSQALWDAGDNLAKLNDADLKSNTNSSGRRLYFGTNKQPGGVPGVRLPFQVSASGDPTATDITLYNRIFRASATSIDATTRDTVLAPVVDFTRGVHLDHLLYRYPFNPDDTSPAATTDAVRLGDIFHSVPVIVGRPDCTACALMPGYTDYFNRHFWRRKVILVGADDGAFHAFDAGFYVPPGTTEEGTPVPAHYDDGTGKELWAWVPNAVMPTLDVMANGAAQQYSVDGSPSSADVYIDPSNDGSPSAADRQWRTVVLFGERSGGNSVVCLDITQPDTYTLSGSQYVPNGAGSSFPQCLDGAGNSSCGNSNYPALLWELRDPGTDPDHPDLAQTWSKPVLALVKVKSASAADSATPETRTVAIFGGGYDPNGQLGGSYLYMVDVETGKTLLKLYTGTSIPGEVGVLDANFDGYIERIYWTDTGGSFWRMSLVDAGGNVVAARYDAAGKIACGTPADSTACGTLAGSWGVQRIFQNTDGTSQPLFHRPVIVLAGFDSSGAAQYAIGAGSGDRENVLSMDPAAASNRFYFFMDPGPGSGVTLPLTTANLTPINVDDPATTENLLAPSDAQPGRRGWYLELRQWEKVNTPAVSVEGKLVFSTFTPVAVEPSDGQDVCSQQGVARTYVVGFTNGNPPPGSTSRYTEFTSDVLMASEAITYVGEDGKLHVLQSTGLPAVSEPIAAKAVSGSLVNWRER